MSSVRSVVLIACLLGLVVTPTKAEEVLCGDEVRVSGSRARSERTSHLASDTLVLQRLLPCDPARTWTLGKDTPERGSSSAG